MPKLPARRRTWNTTTAAIVGAYSKHREADNAKQRQRCECETHAEETHDASGQEQLDRQRQYVDGEINARKERGLGSAIGKRLGGDADLFESTGTSM